MALSSRELYLVLRARDEASRVVHGLSRTMMQAGAAAAAANARQQAAMLRARAATMRMTGATAAQIAAVQGAAAAQDAYARSLMRTAAARTQFVSGMQHATGLMTAMGVGAVAAGGLTLYALYNAAKAAEEYEKQVRLTSTQVTTFKVNLKELGALGKRVAQDIAIPFEQIQPALFYIFSSTNANMREAEILVRAFSKAAVAGNTDIQTAAKATIAIMNGFNIPLEQVNKVLDVQFQLVRKGVGTYEEFAQHMGAIIPSANRAGQSIETVAAMMALLTRNGLSVAMASTSAARALEAMSHPKTVARLKKMGVAFYDAKGHARPLVDVLKDLRKKIEELPPTKRVEALVELLKGAGGTIQARRFLEQVLLNPGELEELEGYLGDMEGATGAFDEAYGTMADSVASKTQLLKNKWDVLKESIGELVIPSLLTLMDHIGKVIDWFNALPESTKKTITQFLLWGSIIGIVGGALAILVGALSGLLLLLAAAGSMLGIAIAVFMAFALYIGTFIATMKAAWDASEKFRNAIDKVKDAFQKLWDKVQEVAGPIIDKVKEIVGPHVTDAIKFIGDALGQAFEYCAWVINNLLIPALDYLKQFWDENRETIEPLLKIMGIAILVIGVLAGIILGVLVGAAFTILIIVIGVCVGAWMLFIKTVNLAQQAVGWCIEKINQLINWFKRMGDGAKEGSTKVITTIGRLPGMITSALGDLGGLLLNQGRELIGGLIRGVEGAIGRLKSVLAGVTSLIPSWKGPMEKDRKLLTPTGRAIMGGLIQGIRNQVPFLRNELGHVTDLVKQANASATNYERVGSGGLQTAPVTQNVNKEYNNTFHITTQEIDPAVHAAKLGWELQAVLP